MRVLFIGDVVGRPGRTAVKECVLKLRSEKKLGFCIANGENAAGGVGITPSLAEELLMSGVDVLTSGNHIYKKKEILEYLDRTDTLLRPANYPPLAPGHGEGVFRTSSGEALAILHLQGRVFMEPVDCPFQRADRSLGALREKASVIIVDFHAEASSEKQAMGWYLDGRVSAVIGTHTHVQTSDERILPGGTAYITDAGMTGPMRSVIGMDKDIIVKKFLTQVPQRFQVAKEGIELQGVLLEIDAGTGRSLGIERVKIPIEGSVEEDSL